MIMKLIENWRYVVKYGASMWVAYGGAILGIALFFQEQLQIIQPLAHLLGAGDRVGLLITIFSAIAGILRNIDQKVIRDKK